MITYRTLSRDAYNAQRFQSILSTEEFDEKVAYKPYADEKGLVTLGVGMNIESVRQNFDDVVRTIFQVASIRPNDRYYQDIQRIVQKSGWTNSSASIAQLQRELDAVMQRRSAAIGGRSEFKLAPDNNDAEARTLFALMADRPGTGYELKVDRWLAGVPVSRERIALLSLGWNQQDLPGKRLLGPALRKAVADGNRPEAWYEIRFNSNAEKNNGTAKRRYYESTVFGLYNVNQYDDLTREEAQGVLRMTTDHYKSTQDYDKRHESVIEMRIPDDYPNAMGALGIQVQTTKKDLLWATNRMNKAYLQERGFENRATENVFVADSGNRPPA